MEAKRVAGKVNPPEEICGGQSARRKLCHMKHLLFTHIWEIFMIAKEEMRRQLWTSGALQ